MHPDAPPGALRLARRRPLADRARVRTAFKEWAAVVDALERGDQILVLRKGGISEGRGGFQMSADRFWLFPTWHHQQSGGLLPGAAARWASLHAQAPPEDRVRLGSFAEVAAWKRFDSESQLAALAGFHTWREEVVAERFQWGREPGLFALAVRVRRTPLWEAPMRPEYGGCKSWIELAEDPPETGAAAALDDDAFAARLSALTSAWGGAS